MSSSYKMRKRHQVKSREFGKFSLSYVPIIHIYVNIYIVPIPFFSYKLLELHCHLLQQQPLTASVEVETCNGFKIIFNGTSNYKHQKLYNLMRKSAEIHSCRKYKWAAGNQENFLLGRNNKKEKENEPFFRKKKVSGFRSGREGEKQFLEEHHRKKETLMNGTNVFFDMGRWRR